MCKGLYFFCPRPRANQVRRAFTFVELMVVVTILAIATLLTGPLLSTTDASYVETAAVLFAGDVDFAQSTAISSPEESIVVRFDGGMSRWWVAAQSAPEIPLKHAYSEETYDTTLGEGAAYAASGVTFALSNVTDSRVSFNAFGQLDQDTDPSITFVKGSCSLTLVIDADLGFTSEAAN